MSFAWTAFAIGTALSAGGAYVNNKQVAKKQDNNLAQEIQQQGQVRQQANQKTDQLINQIGQSNDTGAKQNVLDQFMQTMAQNKAAATNPLNQQGNVSDAYKAAANNAALGISQYGNTNANLLSSMDAPSLQRQNESNDILQYSSALGGLQQQSNADSQIANMKLQSVQANPWLSALSNMAGSFANMSAAKALRGAGTAGVGNGNADFNGATYTDPSSGYSYNLGN